jgi:hypothetical protein
MTAPPAVQVPPASSSDLPVPHMASPEHLVLELSATILAVTDDEPRVLTVENGAALPSGPLEPDHRTLELGLRAWVER